MVISVVSLGLLLGIAGWGFVSGRQIYCLASAQSARMRAAGRNGGSLVAYEFLRRDGWNRAALSVVAAALALVGVLAFGTDPQPAHLLGGLCTFALAGLNTYAAVQSLKDKRKAELMENREYDTSAAPPPASVEATQEVTEAKKAP